jgi:hypothetical protein
MENCNVYSLPDCIMMGWVWHIACKGPKQNAYKATIKISEGKRPLGRPGD